ncbi:matrix-remodeling-associated protein 5 [Heteronotia binoei]|uniref:matrix-remodeling-associated protein 5 n=1 Tax=Heteronotia binoei TaxID=13085 RepID=UPI00292EAFEC|nr:matrix-remodeling-associated protein 5 [Heteronotia binoei]
MRKSEKMLKKPHLGALSVVLILSLGFPESTLACPHPCACYVPTEVHCTFRSLVAVPTRISKHVERINLGFNSIQSIAENSFAGLTKLELLMIHGNDIQNIPNGALKDLASLQVFKISYNKLQVLTGQTLQGLSSLMRLHVDHNRIEFIHPNAFNGLTSLRLLHLEGNLLQQLHPNTFSTFIILDYFRLSTIKHLYLSENAIRTLPVGIFQKMPILENVYLHGNPWSCDCRLRWLLEWNEKSPGVLKCKKDKIYEDGQLCPKCSYPKQLQTHDIQHLKDISCTKPIIQSPLKLNISHNEEEEEEDDDSSEFHSKEFQLTPWNITLNMTDEHGNIVNLDCEIKKPTDSTKIQWNQISPHEIEINASISLDMECLMNRENYEKLWKLIAYYSEVPVKLEREHMLSHEPKLSYHYRQGSDYDALYYTGVKGRIFAEPDWLMQPLIHIQLNRRQSTGKKVVLSFSTHVSQTLQTQGNKHQRNSWVMIEQDLHTKAVQSVVEGSDAQLSCNVKATESPSIKWLLPDGTKLKAPFKMEDSRFSVLSSGQLVIKSVAYADSGVYHCVAQVRGDIDSMSYRILVQPPVIQPADSEVIKVQKYVGEPILLPCSAVAIPDAHLSWILPNSHVLNDLSNSSNGYLLDNGSLLIPRSHVSDSGYYRCVAINQQGSDQFAVRVTINKMESERSSKSMKFKKHPGSRTSVKTKVQVITDNEGSGAGESGETLSKKLHLKNHEVFLKQKNDNVFHGHVKKNKKGKRKMKLWKGMDRTPEINVAEGRRVFESRRRINMANKQINPQHWASILAKVRGKNLPRTTVVPVPSLRITTETPLMYKTTRPPPPIISPPQKTTMEPPVSEEESSGDIAHLAEREPFSVTVPPIINVQDYNQFLSSTVVSAKPVTEHKSSNTAGSTYLVETPTAKDSWISTTVQSHDWKHSDLRTDNYPIVPTTFTEEQSNEEVISSQPYIQSTLITAHKGVRTAQYTFSSVERPLEADVSADHQASESSKITSTIFMPASPFKVFGPGNSGSIEHQQANKNSDPNHVLEGVTLENIHIPIPESVSVLESTTAPFKKSDWLMTAAATNKLTTMAVIPDHGSKSTTSDSQVFQYSRRRPYGRRRLRPNRFRRPRPISPTLSPMGVRPYIQNKPKTEAATQSLQRYIYTSLHKPDDEVEAANEHKPLEESSSLTTSSTALQKSIKVHDLEAVSVLSLMSSQPRTPATISNAIKEQKSHMVEKSLRDALTTAPNRELFLYSSLGHKPTMSTDNEFFENFEGNIPTTSYEGTDAHTPGSSVSIANFTSPVLPVSSIPEFEEGSVVSSPENRVMPKATQSGSDIVPHWTTTDSTAVHLTDPSNVNEVQKFSASLTMTIVTPSSNQRVIESSPHYSTIFDDLLAPSETKQTLSLLHNKAQIIRSSSHTKETITQLQGHHNQTAVHRTETNYSPVLPIAFAPLATTLSPLQSSTLNRLDHFATKENYTSSQVTSPDLKGSSADNTQAKAGSRQNELFFIHSNQNRITTQQKQVQLKESSGSRTFNSLAPNSNIPHQPMKVKPIFNQPPAFSPPKLPLVRGTVRPPYLILPGLFHHFGTHQPPLHYTNKPEITAYAAHTTQDRKISTLHTETFLITTAAPPYRPKSNLPSRFGNQGETRYSIPSRGFINNYLPDTKDKHGRIINQAIPYIPKPRMPFLVNRTRVVQYLDINSKTMTTNQLVPASAIEKKSNSSTNITQSTPIKVTAIPVPPLSLSTAPPAIAMPPASIAPSVKSQMASTLQFSRSIPNSNPHVPFVLKLGGKAFNSSVVQPSTNLSTQGARPKILTKGFNSLSILAESDAIIPCDATGEPKPFISWTKISTGALMTANTRIQRFEVLKNGTFIIRKVHLQDRGQYLCMAQNLHGVDKMIVLLTVLAQQPKILGSRFRDVTVYFGEKVTMDCQATGIPSPHLSWIFPDRKILQTVSTTEGRVVLYENRTLALKDTNFSDRGVYKCIASNAAGADSTAVRLHIAALPPIIQQEKQQNISLNVGQNVNIHCSAKAAPLPSIRWVLFDGTQIRTSQFVHGNLFVFPNGTLYIRNVSPKDSGSYECIAANMVGAARRSVWLHVKKQSTNARITGSSPQRTDVTYGGTLRLDCSASGDPWPRILWRLPSKRMVDSVHSLDSRIKVFGNGTLVVHSVTDKDAGDYLCVARNKIGDDYVVLKVNVMMKPAKIEHKNVNNHKVMYGGDLKVDCVATGLPNPEISWSLPDGSMVNTLMQSDDSGSRAKRYVVFNNGTLYFNEVGLREEGDYTCYAENQIGKDEMKVRVKVVAEPANIRNKTFTTISVPYGDVISLGCEAKGEPTPKVTWLSPSNRLIPLLSDKYQVYRDGTLLIQKAQRSDNGNYTCIARNSAGEDRKIVLIHVNVQPPRINGHPSTSTSVKEMAVKDSRKLVDCKAEGIPSPRVMWAFPEGVILPAPYYGNRITVHRNGTLDIRGVRQTDSVQLVCIGRNEGGEARLIVQLQVMDHVEKPAFRDPVTEKITATAGHSINLNCSVHGNPQPSTAWILPNGTEVQRASHLHRFYHKRDGILHISALSGTDAGTYRCMARNSGGSAERVVSLKVGLKPEISNQYNNLVSIINGETLQLHCVTQPSQRARITWTLPNGMVLDSPQTIGRFSLLENGTLTVREASVFDRGTYLCKVATEYGSSLMNVPVIVIAYPPRITSEPAPVVYARPGNTVKLNCMAIGIPKAEITWELPDKSHLTTGAQSRLYGNKFLHPQGSLIIQQATQRDAGFYKCTAKNILGSDSKATYIHIF